MGISDEKGDTSLVMTDDNHRMEWIARGITIRFGGTAYFANYPMNGAEVKRSAVKHTLTSGAAYRRDRQHIPGCANAIHSTNFAPSYATTSYAVARVIFDGKIVDVDRRTSEGFTLGSVAIENPNGRCTIEFQNENLIARADGESLAIVPDIISILDAETALPITNETLRFGQRVKVMAVGVPPIMRSDAALKTVWPAGVWID